MSLFYPTTTRKRITDITKEQLKAMGVSALILDVDNTLTTHGNPHLKDEVTDWLNRMRKDGIKMVILSNNSQERVASFADIVGLDFIADGKKPLKSGMRRAAKALGRPNEQLALIGDQIFTDILAANFFGCKSILLEPIELESMAFFKLKRALEKLVLKRYRKKHRMGETV